MIRNPEPEDWFQLRRIHKQFFANEFDFDDFIRASICNFIITDDNTNEIVTATSIRPIAEIVAITNLARPVRVRREALYDSLQIAQYVLRQTPMTQLHAFVQDEKWQKQLLRAGFKPCKGNAVYINV